MFNFFKKSPYNKKMPGEYKHLLNQRTYEAMLDIIFQYFKDKGEQVTKVDNGYIVTKEGEEAQEFKYGLDNLVRLVAAANKEDWESIIYTHFNKTSFDGRHMQYYKKDYEAAKPFLKLLVKDASILNASGAENLVYKTDFPETVTVLVFDYDDKFQYLKQDEITEWEKTVEALFDAAQNNVNEENIEIHQVEYKEGDIETFAFFNGDFSASYMLNIQQNAPFALGTYGAVVAIPTKGAAFASPINDKEVIKRVDLMGELVTKFFEEDPWNITNKFYWYYNNSFHLFPETPSGKEGYVTVSLPQTLKQLLNIE